MEKREREMKSKWYLVWLCYVAEAIMSFDLHQSLTTRSFLYLMYGRELKNNFVEDITPFENICKIRPNIFPDFLQKLKIFF